MRPLLDFELGSFELKMWVRSKCHKQIIEQVVQLHYAGIIHSDWVKKTCYLDHPIRVLYFSVAKLQYSKICLCQWFQQVENCFFQNISKFEFDLWTKLQRRTITPQLNGLRWRKTIGHKPETNKMKRMKLITNRGSNG